MKTVDTPFSTFSGLFPTFSQERTHIAFLDARFTPSDHPDTRIPKSADLWSLIKVLVLDNSNNLVIFIKKIH